MKRGMHRQCVARPVDKWHPGEPNRWKREDEKAPAHRVKMSGLPFSDYTEKLKARRNNAVDVQEEMAKPAAKHLPRPMISEGCGSPAKPASIQLRFDVSAPVAIVDYEMNRGAGVAHRSHHFQIGAFLAEEMRAAKQNDDAHLFERRPVRQFGCVGTLSHSITQ